MASNVEFFRARTASRLAVVAVVSAGIAGCSSDMGRFTGATYTGTVSNTPPAPVALQGAAPGPYATQGVPVARIESQPLPTHVASLPAPPPSYPARAAAPVRHDPQPRAAAPVQPPQQGGTHVVASGETLIGIARRYSKSRNEIAQANGLTPTASVKIGQRLTIPGVAQQKIRTASLAPMVPAAAIAQPQPAPKVVAAAPAPKAVAPAKTIAQQPLAAPVAPVTRQQKVAALEPQTKETARLATPATDATTEAKETQPSATGAVSSFRWPVRGRVIAGFGPKPNGQQNDGINLAVPEGTSVKAAEDGVVAYAGSELKGYGNLVLVRHSNGYVTAYAHASELKVKRGEPVKRGQIIALAGQTGNVSSPQLHFEIRKGSTPVDPTQFMSNN